jgi:hypothetical protein
MEDRVATAESIRELLDKMSSEREGLLAEAEAIPEAAAERAPADAEGEAQWSVKQQLAHLAEMETAYRAWVERAVDEEDPDVSRVRGVPPTIALTAAHGHAVGELTAQLRAERQRTLDLIGRLTPEQYERTARQAMFGRLTVMQWLRSYYRHDRMHRDQIAGRDPAYKPTFVEGKEPDQRRGQRIG